MLVILYKKHMFVNNLEIMFYNGVIQQVIIIQVHLILLAEAIKQKSCIIMNDSHRLD